VETTDTYQRVACYFEHVEKSKKGKDSRIIFLKKKAFFFHKIYIIETEESTLISFNGNSQDSSKNPLPHSMHIWIAIHK
jgi:hypothetical protein